MFEDNLRLLAKTFLDFFRGKSQNDQYVFVVNQQDYNADIQSQNSDNEIMGICNCLNHKIVQKGE